MDTSDKIIKQARLRSQLSRAELSRRTNTTRAALLEYEKGTRTPRFDTLVRLLDATGTQLTITLPPGPTLPEEPKSGKTLSTAARQLTNDDASNWRLLVSDFVANEFVPATTAERSMMLATRPDATEQLHWHLFLQALGEHLAFHAELPPPAWSFDTEQVPSAFWWPVHGELASQRASAMAWSPASFRRRRILIDGRELPIVTR